MRSAIKLPKCLFNIAMLKQDFHKAYPEKQRKRFSVESNPEILRIKPEAVLRGRDDPFKEAGLLSQDLAKLFVVKDLLLVDVGQLLAERDGVLPLLVPFKVLDDFQVELLLALPLLLAWISVNWKKV